MKASISETQTKPLFAERGGESVAVDGKGNVYVASGEILVYNAGNRQIAQIVVCG